MNKTNHDMHEQLELEAKSLVIKRNNTMAFITKHRELRDKMTTAQYPNISNFRTRIKLVSHGLRKHPDYAPFAMMLIFHQPKDMDELSHMLATYKDHHKDTHDALNMTSTGGQPARDRQTRRDHRAHRAPPRRHARLAHHQGKWCTLHGTATHNDDECYSQVRRRRQAVHANNVQNENDTDSDIFDELVNESDNYACDSGCDETVVTTKPPSPPLDTLRGSAIAITADGNQHTVTPHGLLQLVTPAHRVIPIPKVIYTPKFRQNLLSVPQVCGNYDFLFQKIAAAATIDKYLTLSQPTYTSNILAQLDMADCKPALTPCPAGFDVRPQQPNAAALDLREYLYSTVLGSLRYLADSSRPDIAFMVRYFARFQSDPTYTHWKCLKHLLRYLKGTLHYGVTYTKRSPTLTSFSDSDFAADHSCRASTTGHVHVLHNGPVSWTSSRQTVVALSTTEAEYIAAATATRHVKHLKDILHDLGIQQNGPTDLHIDNQSATRIATHAANTKKSKYIDIRFHFLRH